MKRKLLLLGLILALMLLPANFVLAQPAVDIERTWGNDVEWEMLVPLNQPEPFPSNHKSHRPLWIIGAIASPQSPGHGAEVGPHDHVIPVPPKNKGTFNAIWHVYALLPGPSAIPGVTVNWRIVIPPGAPIVYQVSYDGGTTWVDLTSAAKVEAAKAAGFVVELDIGFEFNCPVRPIKP